MNKMNLSIFTPTEKVFEGFVSKVVVPGLQGMFEVHPDHAHLLSALSPGSIRYTLPKGQECIEILEGFVSIGQNQVSIACKPQSHPFT